MIKVNIKGIINEVLNSIGIANGNGKMYINPSLLLLSSFSSGIIPSLLLIFIRDGYDVNTKIIPRNNIDDAIIILIILVIL
jgi:hypothetical protein